MRAGRGPETGAERGRPPRALRAVLALLALGLASVGIPAAATPRAFFDEFPGGAGWVALLPPFNEHLVTDVGGFYLGFAVLMAWAAVSPRPGLVVPSCVALAVPSVLHLGFHLGHLERFPAADAAAQTTLLTAQVVLLVAAVVLAQRGRGAQPTRSPGSAPGSGESSSTPSAL